MKTVAFTGQREKIKWESAKENVNKAAGLIFRKDEMTKILRKIEDIKRWRKNVEISDIVYFFS